ncbi:ACP S-malonyltransferase [Leucobacter chromiiresistens]|uniref:[acyl-carrier-protein] S-malonyltransferase n=2 Tax=Leucobacter chromiiresistens TaxID=1079994 RepID=A0A1H0ZYN4_9MICO|nr:ACP S-malonyltransferase [Leucobacter chromiiresistens]SDQ32361.1 [acyl-carrier-protein] S-malonyltransferase [Leucobacter chromiiresistens]
MIVIACPGQGSQTPGFLAPWLELPGARDFLGEASEHAGVDLIAHGTESDADAIRDTAIAQPLIVAASLLAWRELSARVSIADAGIAGHSVGEFAAAAAAGVLTEAEALRLVAVRGRAMAEAAAAVDTGMAAVVGGVEADVLAKIAEHELTPANRNGGGQIVAAGERAALDALAGDAPRGARVVPLQVAGAFHTEAMGSAIPRLRDAADGLTPNDPRHPLWTNADGSRVTDGSRFVELLISQIASPVRWDACMAGFTEAGITGLVELAPAGALTGIAKRALKGTPAVAIKTPEDLDAAVALITGPAA